MPLDLVFLWCLVWWFCCLIKSTELLIESPLLQDLPAISSSPQKHWSDPLAVSFLPLVAFNHPFMILHITPPICHLVLCLLNKTNKWNEKYLVLPCSDNLIIYILWSKAIHFLFLNLRSWTFGHWRVLVGLEVGDPWIDETCKMDGYQSKM